MEEAQVDTKPQQAPPHELESTSSVSVKACLPAKQRESAQFDKVMR
jgi:hypothetical protein